MLYSILLYNRFKAITMALAILACYRQRARMGPMLGPILLLLCSGFLIEGFAIYLAFAYRSNLWLYNVYIPIEFILFILIAWKEWGHLLFRRALLASSFLFIAIYAWEMLGHKDEGGLAQRAYLTECVLVVGACTAILFRMALNSQASPLRTPLFWFYFSCIVFYGGMIPLMGLFNVMNERNPYLFVKIYSINDVLCHLRFALVALPFFILPKKRLALDLEH